MKSITSFAVTLFVGLAAGVNWRGTPTPSPSTTPIPTPSPGGLPPLPSCVQPYVYNILRQTGCYSQAQDCICSNSRSLLEQSIRDNCALGDQRTALGTLSNYCSTTTFCSCSTPSPPPVSTPTPSPGCDTSNPSIFSLPTCIENCAIPIVRQACGSLNNNVCTCQQRSKIYQCYRGNCPVNDQICAGNILDKLCAGITPTPGTPTPTPTPYQPH